MAITILVVLGFTLGSFINALIWRLYQQSLPKRRRVASDAELSIVKGRSMCMSCGHELRPSDLIPALSWFLLRGKCRYCKEPIPDTPLPELLLPLLLVVSYVFWPFAPDGWGVTEVGVFALWAGITTCFVALALYDAKWFLLPDRVVLPLTVLAALFVLLRGFDAGSYSIVIDAALGALTISGIFWLLSVISRGEWIGWGDVKLGISLGLLAGTPLLAGLVIFLASLLGTVYVVVAATFGRLRSDRAKSLMKTMLPFGPFLIIGTFVAVLWGEGILQWYSGLFLL